MRGRREYRSGTRWCVWRWKDITWRGEVYLRRLHVFQCPWFSLLVHFIRRPDQQQHQHDHPVSMLSIIVKGYYLESREHENTMFWRSWINWIPATARHRIELTSPGGCVTFCIASRRLREWGFWTRRGWVPWRVYHRIYGGGTS